MEYTVFDHLQDKEPVVSELYERLIAELKAFGPLKIEAKKASIHLASRFGFAGVHTRKNYINLELHLNYRLSSPRVSKIEKASPNRFHHTIRLSSLADINHELMVWLKQAYDLKSTTQAKSKTPDPFFRHVSSGKDFSPAISHPSGQEKHIDPRSSEIRSFLEDIGDFSSEEIGEFILRGRKQELKKGEFLVREGEICRSLVFVHSGIFSFLISRGPKEHIIDFSAPGKFITVYSSLITRFPSRIAIRAEQDAEFSVWDAGYILGLIKDNALWKDFGRSLSDSLVLRKEYREIALLTQSAEKYYLGLLEEFPDIGEQLSPQLIASYLGITPQTFSKIQSKFAPGERTA